MSGSGENKEFDCWSHHWALVFERRGRSSSRQMESLMSSLIGRNNVGVLETCDRESIK